jgi:rare lipoprotein A
MRSVIIGVGIAVSLVLAGCSGKIPGSGAQTSSRDRVAATPSRPVDRPVSSHGVGGTNATGTASYYSATGRVASGERATGGLTAAHRTLPFGTKVRVTNLTNGKSVLVRINDRGPFFRGRLIDLSYNAADAIGMTVAGVTRVHLEVIR